MVQDVGGDGVVVVGQGCVQSQDCLFEVDHVDHFAQVDQLPSQVVCLVVQKMDVAVHYVHGVNQGRDGGVSAGEALVNIIYFTGAIRTNGDRAKQTDQAGYSQNSH